MRLFRDGAKQARADAMIWTLPNVLTTFRLLAAPLVAITFLVFARPLADWLALGLFVAASVTDYLDGIIARWRRQESDFGGMMDPIADKAMTITAFLVLACLFEMSAAVLLPATAILFREIFVSGLREHLGARAGCLKVTGLAKWKTFAQMASIAALLGHGAAAQHVGMLSCGADLGVVAAAVDGYGTGRQESSWICRWSRYGEQALLYGGLAILWTAAVLTLVTGWDYFSKALHILSVRRRS